MESRWLYRGVEEVSDTGRFCDDEYPHTVVSRSVRYSLREHRDLFRLTLSRYVGSSARLSHSRYDPSSAEKSCSEILESAVSSIPYFAPDRSGNKTERERAVELFNEVADEMERIVARLSDGKVDMGPA